MSNVLFGFNEHCWQSNVMLATQPHILFKIDCLQHVLNSDQSLVTCQFVHFQHIQSFSFQKGSYLGVNKVMTVDIVLYIHLSINFINELHTKLSLFHRYWIWFTFASLWINLYVQLFALLLSFLMVPFWPLPLLYSFVFSIDSTI